jgi:hypothetical protein
MLARCRVRSGIFVPPLELLGQPAGGPLVISPTRPASSSSYFFFLLYHHHLPRKKKRKKKKKKINKKITKWLEGGYLYYIIYIYEMQFHFLCVSMYVIYVL